MRVLRKGCPRCQGDLGRVDDIGESYYSCVQCGHVTYERPDLERPLARVGRVVPLVEPASRPRAA